MPFAAEAIDPWQVKDAVAHIAHYKARVAQRMMKRLPPVDVKEGAAERRFHEYWDPESWAELEVSDTLLRTLDAKTRRRHRMNHLVYLRWHDRPVPEILQWHRFVQKHVISILEIGPEKWFLPDETRASGGSLSHESVATLTVHSDQHLRDIKAAIGKLEGE